MFQYFTLFGNDLDSQLISTIDLTQQNSKVSSYQRILKTMSCKTSSLFKSLLINFYLSSICLTYLLKPIMFRLFMNISQDIKHLGDWGSFCGTWLCPGGNVWTELHMWQFLDSWHHLLSTLAHDTTDRVSAISWGSITYNEKF